VQRGFGEWPLLVSVDPDEVEPSVNRALQRYLEAASGLTNLTAAKAERVVKGLVRSGEEAGDQVGELVEELLERQRRNREAITALVKSETTRAVRAMGLATGKQVERLQKQVVDLKRELRRVEQETGTEDAQQAPPPLKKATAKKGTAKKGTAKKATAKKGTAKKATAKKGTAKKGTAKKATGPTRVAPEPPTPMPETIEREAVTEAADRVSEEVAKKGTAKKGTAKKGTAKKGTAKKGTAKKSTAKKATAVETPAPTSDEPGIVASDEGPPPEASPVLAEEIRDLTDGS
jgi:polyhydroxyalkanoate synthesis regulator phasin